MADYVPLSADERIELHERFWRGELNRPIVGFFIPGEPRIDASAVAGGTPSERLLARHRLVARRHNELPGDRVAAVRPNAGVSFLPALAGARTERDGHTMWTIPSECRTADLEIPRFDRDTPLWQEFETNLRMFVREGIPGAVVTPCELMGPMDCLAAMVGPTQLCLDMVDEPDAVLAKGEDLARLWREVFDAQWEVLQEQGGTAGFQVYLPGASALWSEDVMALTGPARFEPFFAESIRAVASHLDSAFLHTHSAALGCIPQVAGVDELAGVEISNDPNGPPLQAILDAGDRIYAAGKCVMFSNWERPLPELQVDLILSRVDPSRTVVTFQVGDMGEALGILRKTERRFGSR